MLDFPSVRVDLGGGPLAVARPVMRLLFAMLVASALPGCFVSIEDKKGGGVDPCAPNPCTTRGVCGGWSATCTVTKGVAVCSDWKPKTGAAKQPDGYETTESLCDGLDNDCDGLTDEALSAPADACPVVGVCEGATIGAACVGGDWLCDPASLPDFQVTETKCDGKDNDCDGQTDEDALAAVTDCKRSGVCAQLAAPMCEAGAWNCHYAAAADYEPSELSCDGKDNDCDGFADVNLSPTALPGGGTCPVAGVCGGKVQIACVAGVPACAVGQIASYEPFETLCDGKDNDCDGQIDNVHGTPAPLWDADTAACATQGLCKGAAAGTVTRRCKAGAWSCDYAAVLAYQTTETLCDGKDNDCDGQVDEQLPSPTPSPCSSAGVCKDSAPICAGGVWTCDALSLAAAGHEALEFSCDGKDNDCDGQTDETADPAANGCKSKGVCDLGVQVSCAGGKPTCSYSSVAFYEATTETSCDGKDNDCDGQTDEQAELSVAKSGCGLGVCQGVATATCSAGTWVCNVGQVPAYEQTETLCDGKDNDCDGQTDENLGQKALAGCKKVGVCAAGAVAACVGGQSVCAYQSPDFQGAETACDGKDNDCDGLTDPGLCGALQGCQDETACKTGGCTQVLGAGSKVCSATPGQCARLDAGGKASLADSGVTVCADETSTLTCTGGSFGTPKACPTDKPACQAGACKLCIGGQTRCDPADKAGILVCAADGASQTKGTPCATGRCAGYGVCVIDGALTISTAPSEDGQRTAAAAVGEGFAVAWFASQQFSDVIRVRVFDATGKGGNALTAQSTSTPQAASRVAIAPVGTGFAVAWHSTGNLAKVYVRAFSSAGSAVASDSAVGAKPSASQTQPALAGDAKGGVVVWTDDDTGVKSIRAQRLDIEGALAGNAITVSPAKQSGLAGAGGSVSAPAVARLADGSLVVAWSRSGGNDGKDGVYWRKVAADDSLSAPQRLTAEGKSGDQLALASNAKGEHLVVWRQSEGSDGGDIVGVRLDANGKVGFGPQTLNASTSGVQSQPAVTAGVSRFVVTWSSVTSDGGDVLGRDLLDGGTFATISDVGQVTPSTGLQSDSASVAWSDGRVAAIWRSRADGGAKGAILMVFR